MAWQSRIEMFLFLIIIIILESEGFTGTISTGNKAYRAVRGSQKPPAALHLPRLLIISSELASGLTQTDLEKYADLQRDVSAEDSAPKAYRKKGPGWTIWDMSLSLDPNIIFSELQKWPLAQDPRVQTLRSRTDYIASGTPLLQSINQAENNGDHHTCSRCLSVQLQIHTTPVCFRDEIA